MRVWDVTGNVPSLLATVPFDSGGPGVRLRAVTCLQVSNAFLTVSSERKKIFRSNQLLPFTERVAARTLVAA